MDITPKRDSYIDVFYPIGYNKWVKVYTIQFNKQNNQNNNSLSPDNVELTKCQIYEYNYGAPGNLLILGI